jgi:hypothetical protein
MAGPLAAAIATWVLVERTYALRPERLTGLMVAAFGAKMVFFGAYVTLMLTVVGVRPTPFVASFTAYFIGLYAIEALCMQRLFAAGARPSP